MRTNSETQDSPFEIEMKQLVYNRMSEQVEFCEEGFERFCQQLVDYSQYKEWRQFYSGSIAEIDWSLKAMKTVSPYLVDIHGTSKRSEYSREIRRTSLQDSLTRNACRLRETDTRAQR